MDVKRRPPVPAVKVGDRCYVYANFRLTVRLGLMVLPASAKKVQTHAAIRMNIATAASLASPFGLIDVAHSVLQTAEVRGDRRLGIRAIGRLGGWTVSSEARVRGGRHHCGCGRAGHVFQVSSSLMSKTIFERKMAKCPDWEPSKVPVLVGANLGLFVSLANAYILYPDSSIRLGLMCDDLWS